MTFFVVLRFGPPLAFAAFTNGESSALAATAARQNRRVVSRFMALMFRPVRSGLRDGRHHRVRGTRLPRRRCLPRLPYGESFGVECEMPRRSSAIPGVDRHPVRSSVATHLGQHTASLLSFRGTAG